MSIARLALTPGEPAGLGPDITLEIATQQWPVQLVAIANARLLRERARLLGRQIELRKFDPSKPPESHQPGVLWVMDIPLQTDVQAGQLDKSNAAYVVECLDSAATGCSQGVFAGLVTGPVHKALINDSGIAFSGHTEFLANHADCKKVVMMLASQQLRVALVTTHIALREVPDAVTAEEIISSATILNAALKRDFGIASPRILVCGLNPHAGEDGHLGREEIEIIQPALESCRQQGMNVIGPLPADSLFTSHHLDKADAVLAMYHDQGLGPLKALSFGNAVNVTLGLPYVRTSVDHGTAAELAGSGKANASSMQAAVSMAIDLVSSKDGS